MNFIVSLIIFPYDVMFSFGESRKSLIRILRNHGIVETLPNKANYTAMFEKNQLLIRLDGIPATNKEYAILQHEIFHATHFIMEKLHIDLNRTNDEVFAYLIQYLTKAAYNKIGNLKGHLNFRSTNHS